MQLLDAPEQCQLVTVRQGLHDRAKGKGMKRKDGRAQQEDFV